MARAARRRRARRARRPRGGDGPACTTTTTASPPTTSPRSRPPLITLPLLVARLARDRRRPPQPAVLPDVRAPRRVARADDRARARAARRPDARRPRGDRDVGRRSPASGSRSSSTSSVGSTRRRSSGRRSPTASTSTRATPGSWVARDDGCSTPSHGSTPHVVDGAVNGTAVGGAARRAPAPPTPERTCPRVRHGHRGRCRAARGLRRGEDGLLMSATVLATERRRVQPRALDDPRPRGRRGGRGVAPGRGPSCSSRSRCSSRAISGAMSVYMLDRVRHEGPRLPVRDRHAVDRAPRHLLAPGRRRHLAVPDRAHGPAVPARDRWRSKPEHDPKPYFSWLLLLMAGSMGVFVALDLVLFFVFFEIVLVPMYFLIGRWGHGRRVYAANKFFLYTMLGSAFMLVGIVATAYLHQPAAGGDLTFDLVEIAREPVDRHRGGTLALPLVRPGLRGEGAVVPAAHLAARRPHRGAHRRLGDPGRRDAEARHLRLRALRPLPLPRGLGVLRPGAADARRRSASSTARSCATMQRDLKRLVAYSSVAPPRLHRARHLLAHHAGHRGRHPPDGQPRHLHRRRCSSWSA